MGSIAQVPIDSVQPNPWNPNVMSKETYASLKHGLSQDGWLSSQALLVWGSDENGDEKNVIIDGEHRWRVAKEIGFSEVPVVRLSGVSEAKVKSLTVAMNQRRGAFDDDKLAELIQAIQFDVPDLVLSTGLGDDEIAKMLASAPVGDLDLPETSSGIPTGSKNPERAEPPPAADANATPTATVRMVQLFLDTSNIDGFNEDVRKLSALYKTPTTTDTVLEALRRAASASE